MPSIGHSSVPGVDLVMAVDWKKMVKEQAMPGQKLPELSQIADLLPQTVVINAPVEVTPSPKINWWRIGLLLVVLAVALRLLALLRR